MSDRIKEVPSTVFFPNGYFKESNIFEVVERKGCCCAPCRVGMRLEGDYLAAIVKSSSN